MKQKRMALLTALMLTVSLLLTACGKAPNTASDDNPKQNPQQSDTVQKTDEKNEPDTTPDANANQETPVNNTVPLTGIIIRPILGDKMPGDVSNTSLAVTFTNDDIYLNDDGAMVIRLTVEDAEIFDPQYMQNMQVGDVIVLGGQEVTVKTLTEEDGMVIINQDMKDAAGFVRAEDGLYTQVQDIGTERRTLFRAVGTVTIPVDQEFQYYDYSVPGSVKMYYPGDLLVEKDKVDFSCTGHSCNAITENGKIVQVNRFNAK